MDSNTILPKISEISGYDKEVSQIKEYISLALHTPKSLTRFGIKPTKCLLIHGPSGSGKTFIAKSILEEYKDEFTTKFINCSDILMGETHEENEAIIRQVFNKVSEEDSFIIVLDEIDLFFPQTFGVF